MAPGRDAASFIEMWSLNKTKLRDHCLIGMQQRSHSSLFCSHRTYSFISVYCPEDGKAKIFQGVALPFGAVQAVFAFLRIARALWHIATTRLAVCWTSFFDDYLAYSAESLVPSTSASIELFFKLLGWKIAESGNKAAPFSDMLSCLGVVVDLKDFSGGLVRISNTQDRKDELMAVIQKHFKDGFMSTKDAQQLRGRMQFAENQKFGRAAGRFLHQCSPCLTATLTAN